MIKDDKLLSPYFLDSILSLECEEMHILWSIVLGLVTFLSPMVISDKRGPPCVNKVFDFMLNLDSDESIMFWPNDFSLVTFLHFVNKWSKRANFC